MKFGVNYTPSKNWFYSWHDVDWAATNRDFEGIASLGLDHVRILPLWPLLQPNRTFIDPRSLADVRRTVELAGEHGLDAYVDVLQGHLSSYDFVPSWLTTWHRGNMFADPQVVAAQAELVRALHEHLADVPTYRGLTLGNEVNQFSGAPHPAPMRATVSDVDNWLDTLLGAVRGSDRVVLHAEYDAVWYLDGHPFLPRHAARIGDLTSIHSWVFNGTAQRYGGLAPESVRHAEYLIELSRAFATDLNRPVWLQEIGAPANVLADDEVLPFMTAAVTHAADCDALWGVTWWCSHDVDPRLADFPPFEHALGLLDQNNRPKPQGRRFAELAAALRDRPTPPQRSVAVVIPVTDELDTPTSRAALGPGGSIFEEWMRLAELGQRPALVTATTAADPGALAARGIGRVYRVSPGGNSAYTSVSDDDLASEE